MYYATVYKHDGIAGEGEDRMFEQEWGPLDLLDVVVTMDFEITDTHQDWIIYKSGKYRGVTLALFNEANTDPGETE